jgi:uncharacterized membrane protein (DUF4010 family)
MTRQYLCGELSVRLANAPGTLPVAEIARLREQAEAVPPTALAGVVVRALDLGNRACWEALAVGDLAAFADAAAYSAELVEFAVCARLLNEA